MKGSVKRLKARGRAVAYTLMDSGARTVCFMFSGIGYSYDHPLLYYATMEMRRNGIDVVQVHYRYDKKILEAPFSEQSEIMMNDIQPVMVEVLSAHAYEHCLFLGKSVGTIPIIGDIIKMNMYQQAPVILLTPLITSDALFANLLERQRKGLIVIGDDDHFYDAERMEQLKDTQWTVEVIPKADHSLNVADNDAGASVAALARVVQLIGETVGHVND